MTREKTTAGLKGSEIATGRIKPVASRSRFCRLGSADLLSNDFAVWDRVGATTENRVATLRVSEQIAVTISITRILPTVRFGEDSISCLTQNSTARTVYHAFFLDFATHHLNQPELRALPEE
jgi:hypothetical protein